MFECRGADVRWGLHPRFLCKSAAGPTAPLPPSPSAAGQLILVGWFACLAMFFKGKSGKKCFLGGAVILWGGGNFCGGGTQKWNHFENDLLQNPPIGTPHPAGGRETPPAGSRKTT